MLQIENCDSIDRKL